MRCTSSKNRMISRSSPGAQGRAASKLPIPCRARRPVSICAVTRAAAQHGVKRLENVDGPFWVDSTCIDCDTCRWMVPHVFDYKNGKSRVFAQPNTPELRLRATQALLSCLTHSIHGDQSREELQGAQRGLPAPVPGLPGIFHNGWHDERSFGAASYLIQHPAGNIMVDCPRFGPVLARQLEALGGVAYIFLTHKDDVGDHAKWAKHFNAVRVIHGGEVQPRTRDVEVKLQGEGPWSWADVLAHPANHRTHGSGTTTAADDPHGIQIVYTPGHSPAHVVLLHPPTKTLFSGDHLSAPEAVGKDHELYVFEQVCWYSFPEQLRSVTKLLDYDWLHVLPGHGRAAHMKDAAHRLRAVSELLQRHGGQVPDNMEASAGAV